MKPSSFMGSIDLHDAYFSIPIHADHQKYLKFEWGGTLYKFTCLPQGLASAPRLFTKIMKPIYCHLRGMGHISSGYLDDSFLQGETYQECLSNIHETNTTLENAGFSPHETKSVTVPTQVLEHLGFILNSVTMSVSISNDKVAKLVKVAQTILDKKEVKIRLVAKLVGIMVSYSPGVEYGQLFYRQIEIEKSTALKNNQGNFERYMQLSNKAKSNIKWWMNNASSSTKIIDHGNPTTVLSTDASTLGWAATSDGVSIGGRWLPLEQAYHINYLEMKAVKLGLQSLCAAYKSVHIKVLTDNTTTVAYLNKMGGAPTQCLAMKWQGKFGGGVLKGRSGSLPRTSLGRKIPLPIKHPGSLMTELNGNSTKTYSNK